MTRTGLGLLGGAIALALATAWLVWARAPKEHVACGMGFYAIGARCCPGPSAQGDQCLPAPLCPPPLVMHAAGCDPPDLRIGIPETTLQVGPSDWEAEGRVAPRTVHAGPFQIDAFEVTAGRIAVNPVIDSSRAANLVSRSQAATYCKNHGGRLPTEDEWIVAAAGASGWRYPWGETGAVCRRAAWGLLSGPCARGATGPDTVGAHASGDTPTGIHDMAGNVAEWVAPGADQPGVGVARGGSWQTSLATELRTWSRLELDPGAKDTRVGVRCAYDAR
jgi:sulfatase modifying factor 1